MPFQVVVCASGVRGLLSLSLGTDDSCTTNALKLTEWRIRMSRSLALLLSAAVPLAFAPVARAEDTAKDIIEKAIKAHGGTELLTKNKAGQTKNQGKINIPGVGEVEFAQTSSFMLPDKFKEVLDMTIANMKVNVLTLVNGEKIVLEVNGKEIPIPDAAKAALKDVGYMLKVGRLGALVSEKGFELDLIGEDKVDGKAVVGVRVSSKGKKDMSLFFDKKTHLLAKVESRGADPVTGNEVNEERIIAEYTKTKDGVPIPKKVIVKHDGKQFIEAEVLEVNFLEKLDDSEFKK
jgi:hypothetical protein